MNALENVLTAVLTLVFVESVVRISIPYVLAALGGAITERSGIVDLALEAKLLFGAFAAAVVGYETDSIALAIAAGAAAGAAVAGVQAYWAIRLSADQVVTGIALTLAAYGLTRYLLQIWYGQGANSPPFEGTGPDVWRSPVTWLAVLLAAGTMLLVARTALGLRVRAAGERPDATAAAGVSVADTRLAAALLGGAIAGVGGSQLSLVVNGFHAEMSNGRGYVALAAVIMGGWRPGWVALVCVGFGFAEALQVRMQTAGIGLPAELVRLLPFVLALVLLATFGGRGRAPSALGNPDRTAP